MMRVFLLSAVVFFSFATPDFGDCPNLRVNENRTVPSAAVPSNVGLLRRLMPAARLRRPIYAANPKLIKSLPPSYPYGYFGAQTRPYTLMHNGYFNDFYQLSTRHGY